MYIGILNLVHIMFYVILKNKKRSMEMYAHMIKKWMWTEI